MGYDHRFESPDGHTISYADMGDPNGRPVLFCHGWPGSRMESRKADEASRDLGIRLIAPDRPGIGASTHNPSRTVLDWPKNVAELLTHLGIDEFDVLGVSGGAPYAYACGIELPNRIGTIGICCGLPPIDREESGHRLLPVHRLLMFLDEHVPPLAKLSLHLAGVLFRNVPPRLLTAPIRFSLPDADRRIVVDAAIGHLLEDNIRTAFAQNSDGVITDGRLIARQWGFDPGDVDVPLVFWHGLRDPIVPFDLAEPVMKRFPNATVNTLAEEGHFSLPFTHIRSILESIVKRS